MKSISIYFIFSFFQISAKKKEKKYIYIHWKSTSVYFILIFFKFLQKKKKKKKKISIVSEVKKKGLIRTGNILLLKF